ncbi:MAG: 3-deoxy-manno-octulosonate-8-phosphatase KdsC [Gammaproteobacteria bacterium]|nr:3-deoxy-manno-octulosonate-8-phosphatase KdsC [Gammaproteobacteria bacterium]MBT3489399.1 3-deoxy-manno-octulosonate-8-phosphatase KdsC [Gammaproteobacteria bacterium]MBT3718328.1 3-deoxy-manno-octulosonate-8-phosphatase KdsC [Gammaproteobacteria bacterium]MBT3844061.1 3-deoxy-manno-octulosonate-8-phosphatase KdsC [Gammaproteobacteria bacterium]MBT3892205.1 3-deoxy-manno-octulosonate-8-phosphatase KdsC [Gammaproteobacteria bacterium]
MSISEELKQRIKKTRLVIFDVDGVLTDGRLYFGDNGQEYKAFYSKDGLGMKLLMQSGIEVAIITARSSPVVAHRMENLGIRHFYQGQADKIPAFKQIAEKLQLSHEQVAYVGDDLIDLPVMTQVGLSIAVADAHPEVIKRAHWTTPGKGGLGGARDVCDLIMHIQGTLQPTIDAHLSTLTN